MKFSTVSEWLEWVATLHDFEMDLVLDRVKLVASRLGVLSFACPVIIVGGTNGKGSTVTGLETIYHLANYQVGAFTSPMLFRPNEQIRVNGREVSDEALCQAFEKVADALEDTTLTPFEFFTLTALVIFKQESLDILILEVGLGGRLDAVNIIDGDVAVITTIAFDHEEWLGGTRERIGKEKAGIMRPGKPVVCGDMNPPASLINYANEIGAIFYCQQKEFSFEQINNHEWSWSSDVIKYQHLPVSKLATQNMSTVLMVITLLQTVLPVSEESIKQALATVSLKGRLQIIEGEVIQIYDVSHNPASVALLAKKLMELPCQGTTRAVFSMLSDKDILESVNVIKHCIDQWYVATLNDKRAAPIGMLEQAFIEARVNKVEYFQNIQLAKQKALEDAVAGDRIIVFGSFHVLKESSHAL